MMPRAVPWPDVAREPVLQWVRTEILRSGVALYCCSSHEAPKEPIDVLFSRSLARMFSAVSMYEFRMASFASGCANPSSLAALAASFRREMALERSTAVGRLSLR